MILNRVVEVRRFCGGMCQCRMQLFSGRSEFQQILPLEEE